MYKRFRPPPPRYNRSMSNVDDYHDRVETNLRRIRLAHSVVDEVHKFLLDPLFPQERADLLIASENLTEASYGLMQDIQSMVWDDDKLGKPENHPET